MENHEKAYYEKVDSRGQDLPMPMIFPVFSIICMKTTQFAKK